MADDRQPLASDDGPSRRRCCTCLAPLLAARRRLQHQDGCGCLGYSPPWMQRLADVRVFVAVISVYWLLFTTLEYYLVAAITTIEKRFGYSSRHSGLLLSMREMIYVLVVVLTSHLARGLHRPRFVALAGVLAAVGGLTFALPHFIYDRTAVISIAGKTPLADHLLQCLPKPHNTTTTCSKEMATSYQTGSYVIFVAGSIIIGVALSPMTSLSVTYVDDASGPRRSAMFLAIMNMMRPLGPVLAFILGSIVTSHYETLTDPGFDQHDPRWVGAWWVGYLVLPAILLLPVVFLPLFPFHIRRDPVKDADFFNKTHNSNRTAVPQVVKVSLKDVFVSLWQLMRNPVYMTLQLGACFSGFVISGLFPFIPKYIEVIFHLPASTANILAGGVSALMAALGVFVGGFISSRAQWSPRKCASFILITDIIFTVSILTLVPIRCPDIGLVRTSSPNSTCLDNCHCLPEQFHPVCGTDGRTYLSPCEAGCLKSHQNNTWSECGCLGQQGGTVSSGVCSFDCGKWVGFAVVVALEAFVLMMETVPATTICLSIHIFLSTFIALFLFVCLRVVKEQHRAIALGFAGTLGALVSFVPGPMIFGALIDSSCLIWRESCDKTDDCLLYDSDKFRYRTIIATFGFKLVAALFYGILYWLLQREEQRAAPPEEATRVQYIGGSVQHVESPVFRDSNEIQIRV